MATQNFSTEKPLKGVLIDLDGTLIDHLEAIHECYQHVAIELNYPLPTQDQVLRAIGGSMPITMQKFFRDEHIEQAIALWRSHFDKIYLDSVKFMPGAMDLLETLKKHNIPAAVFTNKPGKPARGLCDALGATPFLKFVLGADDTAYRKPNLEFSEYALSQLGTQPSETIMVGDSPFDIEAAQCVGMTSFSVPTGSHSQEELLEANTHQVFASLSDIATYIDQLPQVASTT